MRKAIVFAMCMALTACDGVPILNGHSVAQTAQISQTSTKALLVAHLSYNGLSKILLQSVQAKVLKGNNAAMAQIYYNKAGDALDVADSAYAAANETDLMKALADANSAIAQSKKLVGG